MKHSCVTNQIGRPQAYLIYLKQGKCGRTCPLHRTFLLVSGIS